MPFITSGNSPSAVASSGFATAITALGSLATNFPLKTMTSSLIAPLLLTMTGTSSAPGSISPSTVPRPSTLYVAFIGSIVNIPSSVKTIFVPEASSVKEMPLPLRVVRIVPSPNKPSIVPVSSETTTGSDCFTLE